MRKTITKAQIKHIRSLHLKKFRQRYHQFTVEGTKSVLEFLHSDLKCIGLYAKSAFFEQNPDLERRFDSYECSEKDMEQLTSFKTHQTVLAVFEMPAEIKADKSADCILALDDIRDPGNLGTIIRIADWFGFNQVICSETCAESFNPKVVQASMGSLSRINVVYTNLEFFAGDMKSHQLVLADMQGVPVKEFSFSKNIIVIGNEANGISESLRKLDHAKVTIPKKGRAESLNAAVSAGIILSYL
jgi:RNA methyltransferase, TrmH family